MGGDSRFGKTEGLRGGRGLLQEEIKDSKIRSKCGTHNKCKGERGGEEEQNSEEEEES